LEPRVKFWGGSVELCNAQRMNRGGGDMTQTDKKNRRSRNLDSIIEDLMDLSLPKSERIQLMKELIAKGEELPDEVLEEGLKRLMEKLLE
jgi:hypothetical protein